MAAVFVGDEPLIRIDDKPVMPGDVVSGPEEVVQELLRRNDFIEHIEVPETGTQEE